MGGDLDLVEKPLGAEGGGELRAKHLDRHLTMVLHVLGEVDGGHTARAQFTLDGVAVGERTFQLIDLAVHAIRKMEPGGRGS